ncbi:protein melted-like [Mercenaria mercenaria]|uniref:protein melted-like n=1 Tax=Mercenaria mercenaria TaxID=6596 RepID=UPI00234EA6BF|nr:protein melted-like [Mercenaria mercenaria]
MHELFSQVLTRKDLSKAGELFSLEDNDIKNDLTAVLESICEIAKSPEYASSDNNQSVVEICITRVTSAIRETHSIEENVVGLVKLLEVCNTHNLKQSVKDTDPPHVKIASDIMSCLFMHYGKEKVMTLAIPVAVKFLTCDHKELSHNVASYLSLAAIDNADMLAKYMDLIVSSILKDFTYLEICGQKEMRSVSSQTEGTVTIITVGNPAYPSNVVGVRQQQQQPNSARSSQQSLSKASRNSSSNVRTLNDRPVSPASTLDRASLNSALTLSSNPGLPPEPVRDGVQHFCEKHLSTIRNFISSLSARIPLPAKCSIVDGRHKRYVRLNFQCGINGKHCLYGKQFFTLNTKLPKTWIHLMFLAVQAQSQSALSQQDVNVSSLKACWDALYPEKGNSGYLTLVTSSFPVAKDQDALLQEMHNVRYFDVFEFNAVKKYWACFMCNHPEKMSELMPDGNPVIAGQLKEKKGRWRFLKRWKTRYFTLSGTQISYNKSDSRKETLPVREIQSVKAVRKGIRDIPKAFEIFTSDQNYVFKAKGQQNIEPWVQCIHLAVAKANDEDGEEHQVVEDMMLQRPRSAVRDTKL